jgi:steroid 5-alpha reductase family enzyme
MNFYIQSFLGELIILTPWLTVWVVFWFIVSIVKKRNDVADLAWGLGFIGLSSVWLLHQGQVPKAGLLSLILVIIWGLRLASHIYTRIVTRSEDARYATWREQWGKLVYVRSFLQVFLLQTILLLIISLPVLWTTRFSVDALAPVIIGTIVWLIGFLFEFVGDRQLRMFIQEPSNKGRIMDQGLWKYSRHPNYFGEMTQWWGLWIIALSAPFGWVTVVGPLLITFLLVKVSGVPLLEKRYEGNQAYDAYKKRTSMIIPWPPKKA